MNHSYFLMAYKYQKTFTILKQPNLLFLHSLPHPLTTLSVNRLNPKINCNNIQFIQKYIALSQKMENGRDSKRYCRNAEFPLEETKCNLSSQLANKHTHAHTHT